MALPSTSSCTARASESGAGPRTTCKAHGGGPARSGDRCNRTVSAACAGSVSAGVGSGRRREHGRGVTLPFLSYCDPWQRQMNLFSACGAAPRGWAPRPILATPT